MSASIGSRASIQARQVELLQARHLVLDDACNDEAQAEPWPDTQTLVSIDTWTLPTPQTLVSIDTTQTLLRHVQTLLRHSHTQNGDSDR